MARLLTCDDRLDRLFRTVVEAMDCTVLCGHRSETAQDIAFEEGHTQVQWPNSKHNSKPSKAIDVAPFPIDWENTARFRFFAAFVLGVAYAKNIPVRWGGDWDRDYDYADNHFNDLVHFEIVE